MNSLSQHINKFRDSRVPGALLFPFLGAGGEAYHCLAQLLPWWPSLKASRSLEIVGIFSKMQSFAHEVPMVRSVSGKGNGDLEGSPWRLVKIESKLSQSGTE